MIRQREILGFVDLQVYQSIRCFDRSRIVNLHPYSTPDHPHGKDWSSLNLANHNIFRLDANQRVVWQIRRLENPTHANWEILHELAKRKHAEGAFESYYTADGYMDPFFNMTLDERGALAPESVGIYRPGCKVYLTTRDWLYELDVETGIATCTGDQVK